MYSNRKSLNFGQYVPNDKVLNKKVPENPRYKHVRPAVDTGKNVKRHIHELKEKQKNFSHKKDEVFSRVKFSTFIKLAITVAKDNLKHEQAIEGLEAGDSIGNSNEINKTDKTRIANVLIGIGEIDLRNEKRKSPTVLPRIERKIPYLLLDVRDGDEFLKCHIKTAKHYPAAMLSRSICYEIEEMKLYKNNRPELIILYDEDESISSRVATTLVQRGYENVYVLSGGLKLGYEIFPHALITSILTGHCDATNFGPTSTVQVKTSSTEYFSQEDVENVQQYMEDCPRKGNYPVCGSKSYTAHSKSGKSSSCCQKVGESAEFISKYGPATSRRDSASSSKGTSAQLRVAVRSANEGRSKGIKKTPWK